MGLNDHALVVGINQYPELSNLQGPEADAKAFADWLKTDVRVKVPDAQVTLLLSSDYAPAAAARDAKPITADVNSALEAHIDRASLAGNVAGDRLYLYFAGHGMAPDADEVALLMANAGRQRTGHHIPGRAYTRWFRQACIFREIVLFMDCCREPHLRTLPNPPPWTAPLVLGRTNYCYGFATSWPSAARETAIAGGGAVRGVFTQVMLEGLKGGVELDDEGRLTASMLEGYVLNRFKQLFQQDADHPVERQEPKFESEPNGDFVLLKQGAPAIPPPPPALFPVQVQRRDGGSGDDIRVFDGGGQPQAGNASNGSLHLTLPKGLYKATAPGPKSELFEVRDEGGPIRVSV